MTQRQTPSFLKFCFQVASHFLKPHKIRWQITLHQTLRMFWQSVVVVLISSLFVGAIMAIVFEHQLSLFKSIHLLGAYASSGLLREVAPLLVAFVLCGKNGAYVASELSTMKATEQLDALSSFGLSKMHLMIVPRVIGIFLSTLFALGLSLLGGILGAFIFSYFIFDVSLAIFFSKFDWILSWQTSVLGSYKCICFASSISLISTYAGISHEKTTLGVAKAVKHAAMGNMLAIILLDLFTSYTFALGVYFL